MGLIHQSMHESCEYQTCSKGMLRIKMHMCFPAEPYEHICMRMDKIRMQETTPVVVPAPI